LQGRLGENPSEPNHRNICRPFGENIGMSLGESAQFVILMADELAIEFGLNVYGSALSSHIHADGFKKSISGPGAGNYLTVGTVMHQIQSNFGQEALNKTFFHAHGTSTPQNRESESHIISSIAKAMKIGHLPVTAIKSYLGHSLAAAGGDQMINALGTWKTNWIPGITTTPALAENVTSENVNFLLDHLEVGENEFEFAVLNAKGFGGNNGTSLVASPSKTMNLLEAKYSREQLKQYQIKNESIQSNLEEYKNQVMNGSTVSKYTFGENVVNGLEDFTFHESGIINKMTGEKFNFESKLPYKDFL